MGSCENQMSEYMESAQNNALSLLIKTFLLLPFGFLHVTYWACFTGHLCSFKAISLFENEDVESQFLFRCKLKPLTPKPVCFLPQIQGILCTCYKQKNTNSRVGCAATERQPEVTQLRGHYFEQQTMLKQFILGLHLNFLTYVISYLGNSLWSHAHLQSPFSGLVKIDFQKLINALSYSLLITSM